MNNATEAHDALESSTSPPPSKPKLRPKQLIDSLLHSLDALVFVEICIVYYLSPSTAFLFFRAASQIFFVSPRLIQVELSTQPRLPPVIISNLIVIATHLISNAPEADDAASQGYLHGGLFVDFVGELGPSSKLRILCLDLLILGLQLIMLAIGYEQEKIEKQESGITEQDLEAEEAGVRRSLEIEDDIELANMAPNQESGSADPNVHPIDRYYADPVLFKLDLLSSLKGVMANSNTATATSNDSVVAILTRGVNQHPGS